MTFRWLPYSDGAAAWNMAVDEAILDAHLEGAAATTLRFYGWTPPAVSLGYAQRLDNRIIENIKANGFSVVRRPTGGRAVLHQGDLTYSFISSSPMTDLESIENPQVQESSLLSLPPSVSASYLQICAALVEGLKVLGVDAAIGRGKGAYNRFQDCFQATTTADLQVDGLKIIGSAQLRRKHAVLQHGSILLDQKQDLMARLLQDPSTPILDKPRHRNLFDVIGKMPITHVEHAFVQGFNTISGSRLEAGKLSDFEIELARKYLPKYEVNVNQQAV